ncbi:MAG: phosphoribosylformylglycinamidine synthase subunit PurL [Candidatus Aminicenantes bacterium]|nr:phosphoribosylformylglycinamidine synthase subunit PurL [Candidatus Aminicenantes bacterium]
MIDKKLLDDHNLTHEEYDRIVELIGREPNLTELGIFSLMWSEHCSYKSSKVHLQKLPVSGKNVIQGPGENAGIIDIGDGLAAVFKIESHNHPSYIEPYQGAATGVGGILRDIFTMGARPIALLDSLRFGPLDKAQNKSIMSGVVSGISGYGNSMGIPTVGGETCFHECYSKNPLVNVFALGLVEKDKIFYAKAEGIGNPVLYVGAKTGRDGIHGATMASAEFGKDSEAKRPNVQVGDPFREKLLMEACLEATSKNLIIGIQDMGAAGLTCSTTEMASKSGTGIEINLDKVPQRETGMTPYEIMLSESQERMLIITGRDKVDDVQKIFAKWDLDAVIIGRVTEGSRLKVSFKGKIVVDIPVEAVVNLCPVYQREICRPASLSMFPTDLLPDIPGDLSASLLRLLSSPSLADKEWIFRQYDHMVQINTAFLPGMDAALLRLKDTKIALALTLDGNGLYAQLDPRTGGKAAVAEACRNLACVGALPMGVTNCLNFGNPEKPETMWRFQEVVEGISEACRVFDIPVTGGNVSFYNESEGKSIYPTPVLGVVGKIDDINKAVDTGFKREGDDIILLGTNRDEAGASLYLKLMHGLEFGPPPQIDLEKEKKLQKFLLEIISLSWIRSAHDVSEGGLAVCLAECCFSGKNRPGFSVTLEENMRPDTLLFGESQSRVVISAGKKEVQKIIALAKERDIPCRVIGKTGGKRILFKHNGKTVIDLDAGQAFSAWKTALPKIMAP